MDFLFISFILLCLYFGLNYLSSFSSTNNSISSVTATPPPPPPANGINLAPNKSSLFAKSANNLDSSSSSTSSGTNITPNMVTNNGSGNGTTATAKPVPNHGKPNCAPKPPGIQQIIAAKNGVSRHHSMRSPRYIYNQIYLPHTRHF